MSTVATITTPFGATMTLDKFLTPDGRVPDALVTIEEELTAMGVDGRRFRDVSSRFPQFTAQILQTVTDYPAAVRQCRVYDRMVTKNVKLFINNLGSTSAYTYPRVHVWAAAPVARPGKVAGATSYDSHDAYVMAELTMSLMEVVQGQNP